MSNVIRQFRHIIKKRLLRKAERNYTRHPSDSNLDTYKIFKRILKNSKIISKRLYYINEIACCGNNTKNLNSFSNSLLGRSHSKVYPNIPDIILCTKFSNYLINKIDNIYLAINLKLSSITNNIIITSSIFDNSTTYLITPTFTDFISPSNVDIYNLIILAKLSSPIDPIPLVL